MSSELFTATTRSPRQTEPLTEKEEKKMSTAKNTFKHSLMLGIALVSLVIFGAAGAFAQAGGVDADICWIREAGVGPVIDLAAAPVPCPIIEDGLARSDSFYFYTTNGSMAWEIIYKIDLTGARVDSVVCAGANFQALAYVKDADGQGNDLLYGLDEIGNQMIEINPVSMAPTGLTIPIPMGAGRLAASGGTGHFFVQVDSSGTYEIWRHNTRTGSWGPHIPTPRGGAVRFDGLSIARGVHVGTVVVSPGGSNIWRFAYPGPWAHVGGYPSVPFRLSALGAFF